MDSGVIASSAKRCDGNQTRIVPAVYDAVLYQLLDVTLTGNDVGQVQLCKLDLTRRILKLTLSYDPVVQRTVILKLQRTDGMGNALDGILDRMRKIVHRIDAPFIAGIVMCHMSHTVDDRVSHVDIRGCHIDLGTQHLLAVLHTCPLSSPQRAPGFPRRYGYGTGSPYPASVKVTAVFTDLIRESGHRRRLCPS